MELFNYYSLDECPNKRLIFLELKQLKDDGKIEFNIEGDILKLEDLDLDELEIKELSKLLDDNDIFVYPDYIDDNGENFDFDDLESFDDEN